MTSGGLVIVGAMEVIVSLVVALAISAIPLFAMILDPIMSILGTKNVLKVSSALTQVVPPR
jgi:hypothetical protein